MILDQPPENVKVEDWRLHQLIEAGYSVDEAAAIAGRHDIDLHQAVDLINHGCTTTLAAAILL